MSLPVSPGPQDPTPLILHLWSNPTLLPSSLPLPPSPSPRLLSALLNLANLTPSQPERAWNLISTYFHARIREASYTGRAKGGVYAVVVEEDVVKACGSVRRMSIGMGMEGGVKRNRRCEGADSAGGDSMAGKGKRKWSIRDEIAQHEPTLEDEGEEEEGGKRRDSCLSSSDSRLVDPAPSPAAAPLNPNSRESTTMTNELPPLPAILDMHPYPELQSRSGVESQAQSQDRIELPPIYTLPGHEEHHVSLETLIEAARGAMHEQSLRRKELEDAEDMARLAKGRFVEARRLAERLREEVKKEGERGIGFR